jgi:hypothetical protein
MRAARGSIRQRGRESWELSVRIDGRRARKTIRAADRSAAESALLDFRRELRDEGVPESDPLVRELAAEWLGVVSTRVKERTATRYRQLLDHALAVIGGMHVRAVKPGDCQRVLDRMTTSPRTKLHVYRVASEMFGEAVGWGVLQTNPWSLVRAPRPERTQLRIPTVGDEDHPRGASWLDRRRTGDALGRMWSQARGGDRAAMG